MNGKDTQFACVCSSCYLMKSGKYLNFSPPEWLLKVSHPTSSDWHRLESADRCAAIVLLGLLLMVDCAAAARPLSLHQQKLLQPWKMPVVFLCRFKCHQSSSFRGEWTVCKSPSQCVSMCRDWKWASGAAEGKRKKMATIRKRTQHKHSTSCRLHTHTHARLTPLSTDAQ